MQASPLDDHSKMQASPMNVDELAATPGSTSALIRGAPDIKPDGKYDTPPMVYTPGGNNQPYGRILAKALEDHAIRKNHTDMYGNASTLDYRLTSSMMMRINSWKIFLKINILIEEVND
jgi:hypothetical protein